MTLLTLKLSILKRTCVSTFILLGLSVSLGLFLASPVKAQEYPSRTVKIIVPFAAGGPTDVFARLAAQKLTEQMGQSFIVENRPGATGSIGSAMAATSPADGYTLLLSSTSSYMSPYMQKNPSFNPAKDFTPIINLANLPFYFVTNPKMPANTLMDIIALAKQKPGGLNFGSPGIGSAGHLCVEMFMNETGTKLTHVPYSKGAALAVSALMSGEVDFLCDSLSTSHVHVKAGKLKGLGLTAAKRFPTALDIPTTTEAGLPNFELTIWFALFGPVGMPPTVTQKLNAELNKIMQTPELKDRVLNIGGEFSPNTPEQFSDFIKRDMPKWVNTISRMGLKTD
ncbi:MAG: tripartite tricarboxylate transporter substrate binding protein [Betaproteobacteria bacterium]